MKKIFYLAILAVASLTSCEKEWNAPELSEPKYTGPEANITVAELKSKYAAANENGPAFIDVDYILRATVTANDRGGNIYKSLYVEDETGAIYFSVDHNGMYTSLHVGQVVYFNLHGLSFSTYGKEPCLVYNSGDPNKQRIPWEMFRTKFSLDGWPKAESAKPKIVEIAKLGSGDVFKLVKLEKVKFKNAGKHNFTSNNENTDELIVDAAGNSIIVRTSSYAKFAYQPLPKGECSLVGIMSKYGGKWQLMIRTADDITNAE